MDQGIKSITGVEPTEESIKTAQTYIQDEQVNFVKESATNLPFEEESFDTVVSWEVIEHIPKHTEEKMFKEVFRVLKPSGKF